MTDNEVMKLLFIIRNCYHAFEIGETRIQIWTDILKTSDFESAHRRLKAFISKSENKFPPHPGALMEPKTEGRYIPDAAETREMLEKEKKRIRSLDPVDLSKHRRMLPRG